MSCNFSSTIGNRAVGRLLTEIGVIPSKAKQAPPVQRQELVQRQEIPEEEEPLQGKMAREPCSQRQEIPEEEEPLQGKFENKPEIDLPFVFRSSYSAEAGDTRRRRTSSRKNDWNYSASGNP